MRLDSLKEEYVAYKHSLGREFKGTEFLISAFVRAMGGSTDVETITDAQCDEYLASKLKPVKTGYWLELFYALDGMFQWAMQRGYTNHNPMPKYRLNRYEEVAPHIYTNEELRAIFKACLEYQVGRKQSFVLYPECILVYLKILLTMGLRPSEGLNIRIADVHTSDDEKYIIIRETKFFKSRLVTFNDSVKDMINSFLKWRRRMNMPETDDTYLFLDTHVKKMNEHSFRRAYRMILDKAGVKKDADGTNYIYYRLYDFRHTFATRRVEEWYKEGVDLHAVLPLLSTYLGHARLEDTTRYITMTDAILQEASNKFRCFINE